MNLVVTAVMGRSVVTVMLDLVVTLATPATLMVTLVTLVTPAVVLDGSVVLGPLGVDGLSGSNESSKSERFHLVQK